VLLWTAEESVDGRIRKQRHGIFELQLPLEPRFGRRQSTILRLGVSTEGGEAGGVTQFALCGGSVSPGFDLYPPCRGSIELELGRQEVI
jgi:hypothetical protein